MRKISSVIVAMLLFSTNVYAATSIDKWDVSIPISDSFSLLSEESNDDSYYVQFHTPDNTAFIASNIFYYKGKYDSNFKDSSGMYDQLFTSDVYDLIDYTEYVGIFPKLKAGVSEYVSKGDPSNVLRCIDTHFNTGYSLVDFIFIYNNGSDIESLQGYLDDYMDSLKSVKFIMADTDSTGDSVISSGALDSIIK